MGWMSARIWAKGIGLGLAAGLWLSLLSFNLYDPSFTNLRMPSDGVQNLLGVPGALLGGSLVELFGGTALLTPLLLINWFLTRRNRPALWSYLLYSTVALVALTALMGLVSDTADPGLEGAGLVGWAGRHWIQSTTGVWLGAILCGYALGYALTRLAYAPVVDTIRRDVRTFLGFFLRTTLARLQQGWGWTRNGLRVVNRAAARGAAAVFLGVGGGLRRVTSMLLGPPRAVGRALSAWRFASIGKIKTHRPYTARPERYRAGSHESAMEPAPMENSAAFDTWFAPSQDDPEPGPGVDGNTRGASQDGGAEWGAPAAGPERGRALPPEKAGADGSGPPQGASAPEDPPGGGAGYTFENPAAEAAWRDQFRRYARNLDLDWHQQPWRRQEGSDEDDGVSEAPPQDKV